MAKRSGRGIAGVLAAVLCCWTTFWGCGTSTSGGEQTAGGGIGGTGISIGSVSGVGSVVVNGSRYATATADVFVEGELVGAGDQTVASTLDIGKVVRVEAEIPDGGDRTATRIDYNDNVEGPVDSIAPIDADTALVAVMGQVVMVDPGTRFKNLTVSEIAVGNVLEVSGLVDEFGVIHATFIEKKADALAPGDPVDLKGVVQDVDALAQTFRIQMLVVDYGAADVGALPGGVPMDGQLLEVKGSLDENGILVASRLLVEDEIGASEADVFEIEGFITVFDSILDFMVSELSVQTTLDTVFEGLAPRDLTVGERLIVRGELKQGVLIAGTIELP